MALNRPRWRSLKLGDSVVTEGGRVYALVAERRFKKRWSEHSNTVYWRYGLLLDLLKGTTQWEDLDDASIYGEVYRGRGG